MGRTRVVNSMQMSGHRRDEDCPNGQAGYGMTQEVLDVVLEHRVNGRDEVQVASLPRHWGTLGVSVSSATHQCPVPSQPHDAAQCKLLGQTTRIDVRGQGLPWHWCVA